MLEFGGGEWGVATVERISSSQQGKGMGAYLAQS